MNFTPLVSIIMPVYNCEKYLACAIDSVLAQTYLNWELIIVDDNSTDNSYIIEQFYARKDSRIRLIKNTSGIHGPGIARNLGMDHITGKYTYFIDSDDWIEKDLLFDTVSLAEQTNADLIPFGFFIEENGRTVPMPLKPCGNFDLNSLSSYAYEILRGTWSECHELIRSSLLTNIRHNQLLTGEDICFQMDLLCVIRKATGINKEYYHYRVIENSVSHQWRETSPSDHIELWKHEKAFLMHCGIKESSQLMKNAAIERYLGKIYSICMPNCPMKFKEKYFQIKFIGQHMSIYKYKNHYDCSNYHGMEKVEKLFVKHNLEAPLIILGSLLLKMTTIIHQ